MLEPSTLPRAFKYNSVELEDPGAQYSVDEVRDLYSVTYPEIVSAAIEGPEKKDGKRVYTFRKAVGTKGGDEQRGLYDKFVVWRRDDPHGKHGDCRYFVLDLDHDMHAVPAIEAYANSCAMRYPALAQDLRQLATNLRQKHGL